MLHGTTVRQPPLTVFIHQNTYQHFHKMIMIYISASFVFAFANIFLQWPPIKDSEELLTFGKVYRQLKAVSAFPIQAQWSAWEPGWSPKAPTKDPHVL